MKRLSIVLILLCASLSLAQGPIRLPSVTLPTPPAPLPNAATKLNADVLYVIDCKSDCIVRAHPQGLLSIQKKTGPRDVSAVFVDGNGQMEDRTYAGPFLYFIRPIGTGRVEIDVIPLGLKAESEIVTAIIDANVGPRPPPIPPDPKPPDPKPPDPRPPDTLTSFRVFLIMESADKLTADQRGIVYGKLVEDWLNANCTGGANGWRRRDKDTSGENDKPMAPLWAAIQPQITSVPCVAIERNGKVDILPLDATPTAQVETLKKYRGK